MSMTEQEFKDYISTLVIPDNWSGVFKTEEWPRDSKMLEYHLSNSDGSTILIFKQYSGSGTTKFIIDGKSYTFDRRGVEDSFYFQPSWDTDDRDYNPNAVLARQLERIENSKESIRDSIKVPGTNFSIHKSQFQETKDRLVKSGLRFSPPGFGRGIFLSTKKSKWNRRAKSETENFFGISPLYTESYDCD